MSPEMISPLWSWILPCFGLFALWAGGNRWHWGWLVGLTGEVLWLAYGIATRQYGFALSALAFGTMYARNYWRWRTEACTRSEYMHVPQNTAQVDLERRGSDAL